MKKRRFFPMAILIALFSLTFTACDDPPSSNADRMIVAAPQNQLEAAMAEVIDAIFAEDREVAVTWLEGNHLINQGFVNNLPTEIDISPRQQKLEQQLEILFGDDSQINLQSGVQNPSTQTGHWEMLHPFLNGKVSVSGRTIGNWHAIDVNPLTVEITFSGTTEGEARTLFQFKIRSKFPATAHGNGYGLDETGGR